MQLGGGTDRKLISTGDKNSTNGNKREFPKTDKGHLMENLLLTSEFLFMPKLTARKFIKKISLVSYLTLYLLLPFPFNILYCSSRKKKHEVITLERKK
jgi:hypothetical protein